MAWTLTKPIDVRNAWFVWAGFAVVIVIYGVVTDYQRTVTTSYRDGAVAWYSGGEVYAGSEDGTGFVYLPPFAVLYGPVAHLPRPIGESLWRMISIGVLALGVRRLARLGGGVELFPLMTLMAIPCALSSARNGQLNLVLAGVMMFAAADLGRQRWWWCAAWLSLAVALKPQALALAMLMMALHPRLIWRVLIGLAVAALLPFLAARPGYVIEQYGAAIEVMRIASGPTRPDLWDKFADVFGALRAFGVEASRSTQTLTRLLAAAAALGLCLWARRGLSPKREALFVFAVAAAYLMLFNPRTENNGYVIVAPAVAAYAAAAWLIERRRAAATLLTLMLVAMAGSFEIGKLIHEPAVWLAPLAAAGFAGYLVLRRGRITRGSDPRTAP